MLGFNLGMIFFLRDSASGIQRFLSLYGEFFKIHGMNLTFLTI
jgi:hypothetical protein